MRAFALLHRLRAALGLGKSAQLRLMQQEENHYYSWEGKLYDSDIIRACIRPKVRAVGKLSAKHILETLDQEGRRSIVLNPRANIRRLLLEPNPVMNFQDLLEKLEAQLILNGNAFAWIQRDEMGNPVALYPLAPSAVRASYPGGILTLRLELGGGRSLVADYRDIIHLRGDFVGDQVFGEPLAPAITPLLEVATTLDQGLINAVRNSSVIRWLLKFTNSLRPSDMRTMAKEFNDSFLRGGEQGSAVAAVDSKAEAIQVKPYNYVPGSEQLSGTIKRICDLIGTPPEIISSSASEDQRESWFDAQIEPEALRLSAEFSRKLFSARERALGNRIVFEASSWDGASLKTKLELLQMVDRGALLPNEWRQAFNLAPVPGGDEPIRRLDTQPVAYQQQEQQQEQRKEDEKEA